MQQLIVGLGNPGESYARTRHNVGAWLIHRLCEHFSVTLSLKKNFHSLVGDFQFEQQKIYLCIPQVFMNESGRALQSIQSFYKVPIENILIAHDELDLPVGDVKLKNGGGHGGHNGLRNIQQCLGSNEFNRCRIGIDHPGSANMVSGYVLSKPSADDKISIEAQIERIINTIEPILQSDWEQAKLLLHTKEK
jgi:PTH1 family peptidyl-tRNA hydrolase